MISDTQLHLSSFLLVGIVLFVTLLLPFALISCLSGTAHLPFIASDTCGSTSDCEGQHTLSAATLSHFSTLRMLFATIPILLSLFFLFLLYFRTSFFTTLSRTFLNHRSNALLWYTSFISKSIARLFSYLARLRRKNALAFFALNEVPSA